MYVTGEYNYTYADTENTASTKVTAHSSTFTSDSNTYSQTDYYEYDASGNITGIYRYVDDVKTYYYTYVYDEAGQLIRENILEDNKTIIYYYDMGGNIFAKGEFEYTLGEITDDMSVVKAGMYTYENEDWCDQLTHYEYVDNPSGGDDNIDSDLVYDASGNVTAFNGNTYIWTAGRQLDTAIMDDGDYLKYYYNENGFLAKAVIYESDGIPKGIKQFIWDGDKLIAQNLVEDDVHTFVRTIYDADDEAIGLIFRQYDNETDTGEQIWLYRKNLQGDVTGVIDGFTGALIGSFTYDAYGMPGFHPINDNQFSIFSSALTFAMLPQIYRGYTYFLVGNEICYYLGSRFYSPRMGRFLNADKYTDTGTGVLGTNMYAYCNNNPVMSVDPTGEYSRENAVAYAKKWTGGLNIPWLPIFNSKFYYYPNGDCANFVSQCLNAGGIVMTLRWHSIKIFGKYFVTRAWSTITEQFKFFSQWKYCKSVGYYAFSAKDSNNNHTFFSEYDINKQIKGMLQYIEIGDILYLDTHINDGKFAYNHAVIVTKVTDTDIYYSGHTSNRYNQSLKETVLKKGVEHCCFIHLKNYAV
ncbi:MAG: amidase domain-containing protein [Clostridia bacterium]|nr:amidase domain-containing protein [Clostridia bacterium]